MNIPTTKLVIVQFVGGHGEGTYSMVVRNTDKQRDAALVGLVTKACGPEYYPVIAYNGDSVYDDNNHYYDENVGKWLGAVNYVAFELNTIF